MRKFLEQSSVVQTLIDKAVKSLDHISDSGVRNELMRSLQPFYYSTTPTTISVTEIKSIAAKLDIPLTHGQALKILENTRLDLDLNQADSCIKYHFEDFVSNQYDLGKL